MRVYLAASTTGMPKKERQEALEEGKPLFLLETFVSGETVCKKVLNDVGAENFLLDSGAFSFMSGKECSKEMLEEYLDRYIKFINDNDVKYFFELDVDTIFGIEFVERLRKKLERETGKPCIPVWHKGRGIDYWKMMVKQYKYIAIGGLVFHVKTQEYELIRKMVDYAYAHGVKVHGLGFTKTKELSNYRFYSVDSASWVKSAVRGQILHFFSGTEITQKHLQRSDKKYKLGLLAKHNFIEWCKYQRHMNTRRF